MIPAWLRAPARRRPRGAGALTANQHHTDWREYPTNLRPAGWTTPHDAPPALALRVAGLPAAPGGRVLEWGNAGGSRDRYALVYSSWGAYDAGDAAQDQEVYMEAEVVSPTFTTDGTHSFLVGPLVRVGGTGTSETGFRLVLHETKADGVRRLTLNAYTAGAYDPLQSTPFAWEAGTGRAYCLRLRAEGARLRGRAWERGTPEPAAWALDHTLTSPAHLGYRGPPGLQFHEGAEVRVHTWSAALRGEGAPRTSPATPAAPRHQWLYTFGGDALGAAPAGFSSLFQAPAGRFRVVADAAAPGGRALEFAGQAGARGMWGLTPDEVGPVGDVDLYAEVFVPASVPNARFGGLIARAGAAGALWTGWGNDSRADTGGALFAASNYDRWVGSASPTTLTADTGFTTTAGLVVGAWTCLRLRLIRHQFHARYWPRGTAEPSHWWRTTDAAQLGPQGVAARGLVGLFTQEDRTIRWGCLGVGVDGYSAPAP